MDRRLFDTFSRVKERFYLGPFADIDVVPIQERKENENVGEHDNSASIPSKCIEIYFDRNTSDESNTTTEEEQELLPFSSSNASQDKPHIYKHDSVSNNNK